jgi:SAM-dependent methyltransferase
MDYGKEYYDFCKNENNFDMNSVGGWHESYFKFLKSVFVKHMQPSMISLDVGCATGGYLELFRRHKMKMYGCDVSPWYIETCNFPEIRGLMGVIKNNKIPFSDDMFDFIHISQVVEHIPEPFIHEEMKDVLRTLKSGGVVLITTVGEGPAIPPPGEDPTHISCFSQEKWERIFDECGFKNITKEYINKITSEPFAGQYKWVVFVLTK